MKRSCLTLVVAVIALMGSNASADFVNGDVWGTWDVSGSPYEVIGDLFIPTDSLLIIEPGVSVVFNGHYELRVDNGGALSAIGTEADSITFTAADTAVGWGGIYIEDLNGAGCAFSYCTFEYGKSTADDGGEGGAVYVDERSSPTFTHCCFANNMASRLGGAISIHADDSVTILRCVFRQNAVPGHPGFKTNYGGAIELTQNSFAEVAYCSFVDNFVEYAGGAISAYNAQASIHHNVFDGNISYGGGGAMYLSGKDHGDYHVVNNTIVNNAVDSYGGGIHVMHYVDVVLLNNIIRGNTASDGPQIKLATWVSDDAAVHYNNIEGGYPYSGGEGNIDVDPEFIDPGNDYGLRENSPCINTGSPYLPQDPDGTRSDMGAFYCDKYRWLYGHLTVDESPYVIRTDAEVPADSTLVIDPGVEFEFTGPYYFRVWDRGQVRANGTLQEPIVFDAANWYEGWGGIEFYNVSAGCLLDHCIISHASYQKPASPLQAGGISCYNSSPTIRYCRIFENETSNGYGGAIACFDGSAPVLERNQIHHNLAQLGGAIYLDNSSMTSTNNTIAQNIALSLGGGAYLVQNATLDLQNTIMYPNHPIEESEVFLWPGTSVSATYSDIRGGLVGVGNIDENPDLIGGIPFDCNLSGLSPCINTGDPSSALDPDGSRADMGALPYDQLDPMNVHGDWTSLNSPYVINSDVHVPTAMQLVIHEGTTVIFEGPYQFIVDSGATLWVLGTADDSVLFTATDSVTGWGGIRFIKSSSGSSLEYCTIEHGHATGNTTDADGGGIFCLAASPSITSSRLKNCTASRHGGAIAVYDGSHPLLTKCIIDGCEAVEFGGAIYVNDANINVDRCTIGQNSDGGAGGAISTADGVATVSNSIVWDNGIPAVNESGTGSVIITYSDVEGGWAGVGNIDSDPLFRGGLPFDYRLPALSPCVDAGDLSSDLDPDSSRADMGALYYHHTYDFVYGQWTVAGSPYVFDRNVGVPQGASLAIDPGVEILFDGNCGIFVDSSATLLAIGTVADTITFTAVDTSAGWGGIRFSHANPASVLSFCRLRHGKAMGSGAAGSGGGVHCAYSPITISHCDISRNYALEYGAGIYLWESDISLDHCVIHDNTSGNLGGGICSYWSDPELSHNTIAYNTAASGGGIASRFSGMNLLHNIVWDNTGGSLNYLYGTPSVSYCDVEGGHEGPGIIDEDPVFVDGGGGDFELQWSSPCIDAGDPNQPYDADNTRRDLGACPYHHTGTEVSGEVWGVWDRRNHPYYITADVVIPADSALTIEAGTIIYIEGSYLVTCDSGASVLAVGSEQRPITFSCTDTTIGWLGLQLYYVDSTSVLDWCIIEHVETDGSDLHAALYLDHASPIVRHCTIRNNKQNQITGGGIRCVDESSPLIEDCLITNNRSAQGGGGIYIGYEAAPKIIRCTISDNEARGSTSTGGGILCEFSSAVISGCIVENNYIANTGGGIYAVLSDVLVQRTVVANNGGTRVGGIGGRGSRIEITNCTITGHHHTVRTAAVYGYSNSDITITNSILWDNSPAQIYLVQSGATIPCSLSVSYTDLEGDVIAVDSMGENYIETGMGIINSDPALMDRHFCYLVEGSPCIDAGDPDVGYYDVEDPARPGWALWPALGGLRNDMGAYGGAGDDVPVDVPPDNRPELPAQFLLRQNYPNPFNPATTIEYSLPSRSHVVVDIFNILGRKVRTLVDREEPAGSYTVVWDGRSARGQLVSTGVYFYRFRAGDHIRTKKMLFLK